MKRSNSGRRNSQQSSSSSGEFGFRSRHVKQRKGSFLSFARSRLVSRGSSGVAEDPETGYSKQDGIMGGHSLDHHEHEVIQSAELALPLTERDVDDALNLFDQDLFDDDLPHRVPENPPSPEPVLISQQASPAHDPFASSEGDEEHHQLEDEILRVVVEELEGPLSSASQEFLHNAVHQTSDQFTSNRSIIVEDEDEEQVAQVSAPPPALETAERTVSEPSVECDETPESLQVVELVTPKSRDVLFGRGQPLRDHFGNQRMRQVVRRHTAKYREVRKPEKTIIIIQVMKEIQQGGTRFLMPAPKSLPGAYVEAPELEARKKIPHAFRDAIKAEDVLDSEIVSTLVQTDEKKPSKNNKDDPNANRNSAETSEDTSPPSTIVSKLQTSITKLEVCEWTPPSATILSSGEGIRADDKKPWGPRHSNNSVTVASDRSSSLGGVSLRVSGSSIPEEKLAQHPEAKEYQRDHTDASVSLIEEGLGRPAVKILGEAKGGHVGATDSGNKSEQKPSGTSVVRRWMHSIRKRENRLSRWLMGGLMVGAVVVCVVVVVLIAT